MRKLVTIRVVGALTAIEGADRIEVATVDGWEVVVKKGEFQVGDYALYFEIDSFLPKQGEYSDLWSFMESRGTKLMDGKEGFRLRTIKLKGQISQGLLLPVPEGVDSKVCYEEQVDLSEHFGVVKWEQDQYQGRGPSDPKGSFPYFIPKTDEERVQNIYNKLNLQDMYIPTLKLDGSSITVFCDPTGEYTGQPYYVGVCSRNLEIKYDPENRFWKGAINSGLIHAVIKIAVDHKIPIALQGELMGPGIQKNREQFEDYKVFVFNVYDIENKEYRSWSVVEILGDEYRFPVVPTLGDWQPVKKSVKEYLEHAEGPSINNPVREGVVWKGTINGKSFKAISNKYLLNGGE